MLDGTQKTILKVSAIVLGSGLAYYIIFSCIGVFPPCLFNKITGLLCPGCGMTRMFLYMLKFDFVSAFESNRCAFVFLWLWMLYGILCFIGKPKIFRDKWTSEIFFYFMMCTFVVWEIVRNIF